MKKEVKAKKGQHRKQKEGSNADWQTGDYAKHATYRFILPLPFLMLCRLTNTRPEDILTDFMDNLSCGSWKRDGRDDAKMHLIDYFVAHGYGQPGYSAETIRQMFSELDALGKVWPEQAELDLLELSAKWRDAFQEYWLNKWIQARNGEKTSFA